VNQKKKVIIYTDGGCDGNPGPGGWAAVLEHGGLQKEMSGGAPATTNNRMELQAAIEGLRALNQSCVVELFTDSQYLRQGITEWIAGWKRKGWKTQDKSPVKNSDLWTELDALVAQHEVTWHWVKGHSGARHNERCDLLAGRAIAHVRQQFKADELKALLQKFKAGQESPVLAEGISARLELFGKPS